MNATFLRRYAYNFKSGDDTHIYMPIPPERMFMGLEFLVPLPESIFTWRIRTNNFCAITDSMPRSLTKISAFFELKNGESLILEFMTIDGTMPECSVEIALNTAYYRGN